MPRLGVADPRPALRPASRAGREGGGRARVQSPSVVGGLTLKRRERTRFFFFVALNLLMNVGLTIGQSVSEGLFLSHPSLGPNLLPQLFIATAVLTALATFVYAYYVDKLRNDHFFRTLHVLALVVLAAIILGVGADVTWCFAAYFSLFYVVQGIFNTHFWNYAADYFDTLEARRLFPYFPLGNSLGGFIGGSLASLLAERISPVLLSSGWMLLLVLTWVLIRVVSPRLKGWVVQGSEEADEASLDNMRQGFVFLLRSRLGRWHLALAALMVTSLFFSQFLYSAIFSRAYPDPQALTGFIGRFLALTNLLELALEVLFTPRLIGLAGVGAANVFHPTSTLVAIVAMGTLGSLGSAIFGRINRETFDNAVSSSCRNLLYNAYPNRLRGRIRAFLEGLVTNAGTVAAGLVLMALTRLVPERAVAPCVVAGGVVLAGGFFWVALQIRHEYLNALVRGLKEWSLDLDDATLEFEKVDEQELLHVTVAMESAPAEESDVELLRRTYGVLVHRHHLPMVIERLSHAAAHVREAALGALDTVTDEQVRPALERLLRDGNDPLRAPALRQLGRYVEPGVIAGHLDDPEPRVAAMAASLLVERGTGDHLDRAWARFRFLLSSEQPEECTGALAALPLGLEGPGWELLVARLHDGREPVRLAGLQRLLAADPGDAPAVVRGLLPGLGSEPEEVRQGIVEWLAASREPGVLEALVRRLADDSYLVRERAVTAVRCWADDAVPAVLPLLGDARAATVESAICVLGGLETPAAREALLRFAETQLRLAHESVVSLAILEAERVEGAGSAGAAGSAGSAGGPGGGTLATESLRDFVRRAADHIFTVLEQVENPQAIRNIRRCLDITNRQARGDALEALSNLGDRAFTGSLVTLLDDGPLGERLHGSLQALGLSAPPPRQQVLEGGLRHPDRWVRRGTRASLRLEGGAPEGPPQEEPEDIDAVKYLLFLKKVPLFSQMSLEQLEVVGRIVTEVAVFRSEVVFREGEMGDRMYVIVEGRVKVVKNYHAPNEIVLATLSETDYFGEMAILDREPRSATIVVDEDSRLLSISGQRLRDIVQQKPEIAFEIFKVLTHRLRTTDQRLGEVVLENSRLKAQLEPGAP